MAEQPQRDARPRRRFWGGKAAVLRRSNAVDPTAQLSLLEEGVGDLRQRSALLTKARARGAAKPQPRSAR